MKHWAKLLICTIVTNLYFAGPVQADLKLFAVGSFEVVDRVNDGEGTMSGSHRHRIRTDKLFAGFHLLNTATEDKEVDLGGQLKHAPIWLPAGVDPEKLQLCAEIKSINGYYLAAGQGALLGAALSKNLGMQPIPYASAHSKDVQNDFPEKYILPRVMVATDCDERRSKYYVPVSWDAKPDKLVAVVEIGAATVKASLHPVGADNELINGVKPVPMTCLPSRRVEMGFDCTIELSKLAEFASDAYEFGVQIDRPGMGVTVRTARLSLPRN